MKESEINTQIEVFVCQFGKECQKHNSEELADNLKRWAKKEHKGIIKVIRSGCLGQCDDPIALAIYPDKKFLLNTKLRDIEEIKDYLSKKADLIRK